MNTFLRRWKSYFEVNVALSDGIPWSGAARLTEEEKAWIGPSLAAFQLGESSDGRHLQAAAEACGKERDWPHLGSVTRFFIREEQGHAALLGRFLDLNGMPKLKSEWTDRIFRVLRRGLGLQMALPVLLTAEILSLVYYRALAAATPNPLLRAICRKLLADEMAHVAYEAVLLGVLRLEGWAIREVLARRAHRLLFALTLRAVYLRHRPVLKRGGYPWSAFHRSAWTEFDRIMHPRNLVAPEIPEPGSWEDAEEEDGVILRWEPVLCGETEIERSTR